VNILILLGVAAAGVCVLWVIQNIVLTLAGEPPAWPWRFPTDRPLLRWTSRVTIHTEWLIILIGTPLALGMRPLNALHRAFPTPVPWRDMAIAFAIMFFSPCLAYLAYLKAGWVRFEPQYDQAVRRGKLFRRFFPGPLPLATFEEGVFRGILLELLLQSLPSSATFTAFANALSSALFASVHFVKPAKGKPIWQAAYGYFIVGCLFGLAYIVGGRSLWLPIVVHATAVFVIEVARLYLVFQAPRWLIGFPESPQSGLVGTVFVLAAGIGLVYWI
jgi:CAAX prenyl protease-like protein